MIILLINKMSDFNKVQFSIIIIVIILLIVAIILLSIKASTIKGSHEEIIKRNLSEDIVYNEKNNSDYVGGAIVCGVAVVLFSIGAISMYKDKWYFFLFYVNMSN